MRSCSILPAWLAVVLTLLPLIGSEAGSAGRAYAEEKEQQPAIRFTIAVQASEEASLATAETFLRKDWERAWRGAEAKEQTADTVVYTDSFVNVEDSGAVRKYALREDGVLLELGPAPARSVELPAGIRRQWLRQAAKLRKRHYGEAVPWSEAKSQVPLKSYVDVVDLETGLSFRAQRRAGSSHADVQPLTKSDTAVMKQIYGGTWSWKRRAILVRTEGRPPIASSMHGMPHGGDGIPDNDFSGHFCIHFLGSSTHRSGQEDMAHQLMVHKAAGKLQELLRPATPARLADALFVALHQQDGALLRAVLHGAPAPTLEAFGKLMQTIEGVRAESADGSVDFAESLSAEVAVKATLDGRGGGLKRQTFRVKFARDTVSSPWTISGMDM
ncbi:hypothetical protein ACFFNY_07030 [Paenibacillus hodogayensis]|uniref:Uncharacterized protein n=1 Tax=Paenibacillus hodogayensis TaxID=279208 RepID=A0ABV5VST5_9BACL